MNKKLLSTTALVSAALISSAAVAEFKIGADMSATITMGSDKNTNGHNSGSAVGNETNLLLSGSSDLSNGWKASYGGKVEFDGSASANPDHEYELKIGTGDMYLAFANDGGQSNRTSMSPFVSYPIGSTANAVTPTKPAFAGDSYISGVHQANNIAIGGKVGDGNLVLRYAPSANSTEGDDVATGDNINGARNGTKGSGFLVAYNGKVAGLGINASHTVEQASDTSVANVGDAKESRVGLVYSFGAVKIGADHITYDSGAAADAGDKKTYIVGAAFAVAENTTVGAYVQSTSDESAAGGKQDEDMKMISIGYNLGGGSLALSVVDVEGLGNATSGTSADYQGIMITTKVGF